MPRDDGFRFYDDQNAAPRGPQPAKENPEHPIVEPESRPRVLSLEDTELLPKGEDLEAQVVTGAEEDAEAADDADKEGKHETRCIAWSRSWRSPQLLDSPILRSCGDRHPLSYEPSAR